MRRMLILLALLAASCGGEGEADVTLPTGALHARRSGAPVEPEAPASPTPGAQAAESAAPETRMPADHKPEPAHEKPAAPAAQQVCPAPLSVRLAPNSGGWEVDGVLDVLGTGDVHVMITDHTARTAVEVTASMTGGFQAALTARDGDVIGVQYRIAGGCSSDEWCWLVRGAAAAPTKCS